MNILPQFKKKKERKEGRGKERNEGRQKDNKYNVISC